MYSNPVDVLHIRHGEETAGNDLDTRGRAPVTLGAARTGARRSVTGMARIRGLVALLRGLARLPERLDALNQRLAEAAAALHDAREDPDTLRSRPDGIAEMSRTAALWFAELRSPGGPAAASPGTTTDRGTARSGFPLTNPVV